MHPIMEKIEHIGIAVHHLEEAEARYTSLLGTAPYKREEVASEGVMTSFFKIGESKIELLAATRPDSPIAKYLEKRGEGIHHIAYAVTDILASMEQLRDQGFTLLNEQPKPGADGKLICFVHPKDAHGCLTELCQDLQSATYAG